MHTHTHTHENFDLLFIYFWLCWVFIAVQAFCSCDKQGLLSSCSVWASHCRSFSPYGVWALGASASVVVACGLGSCSSGDLGHRLSSCGEQAWLLFGLWDLPRPGVEPMSPALAGRFFTIEPPGKPLTCLVVV